MILESIQKLFLKSKSVIVLICLGFSCYAAIIKIYDSGLRGQEEIAVRDE